MDSQIPDKLYFKIGEVAKMAEVPTHVLRYWESEFPEIKPKRASSRQRLYRRQDVELILKIKDLLHGKGFTIAGAKKLMKKLPGPDLSKQESESTTQPAGEVLLLKKIKKELQQLQSQLKREK